MITDSAGVPIVVISNDGAAAVTQRIAMSKVQAVLKYKMTSGEVAAKAAADPAFEAEIDGQSADRNRPPGRGSDHGRRPRWSASSPSPARPAATRTKSASGPASPRSRPSRVEADRMLGMTGSVAPPASSFVPATMWRRISARRPRWSARPPPGGARFIATPENTTLMAPDGGAKLAHSPSTRRMTRRCRSSPRWRRNWVSGC